MIQVCASLFHSNIQLFIQDLLTGKIHWLRDVAMVLARIWWKGFQTIGEKNYVSKLFCTIDLDDK